MRNLLPLLLLCATLVAFGNLHAQVVHKCASSGKVSYQSARCAAGARTLRSFAMLADPIVPATATPAVHATARPVVRPARPRRGSMRRPRRKADACARARAQRTATLERVGLRRTYDLLSRLDADVRGVCR